MSMKFVVQDVASVDATIDVELDNVNTCKLLAHQVSDPTGKLLLLRNCMLERRTSSSAPFALVCYTGKEEGIITVAQILSTEGKLGKLLWEQAKYHHLHRCTAASSQSSSSETPTSANSTSPASTDLAPLLTQLKSALNQQDSTLAELKSTVVDLLNRVARPID
jgi:hypothetical protein